MIAVLDPKPFNLSQLYERDRPPFRMTRRTAIAAGVAVAFHLTVGYFLIQNHIAQMPPVPEDPGIVVTTITPRTPPPPPPPTQTRHDQPAPAAPNPYHPVPTDPAPTEVLPVTDIKPVEITSGPEVLTTVPTPYVPPSPKPPSVITSPTWLSKPTGEQVAAYYPPKAQDIGVGGRAVLLCEIQISGGVSNCQVAEETPKNYRFGEAALAITRFFKLSPKTVDGVSVVGSKVRIPIVFSPS